MRDIRIGRILIRFRDGEYSHSNSRRSRDRIHVKPARKEVEHESVRRLSVKKYTVSALATPLNFGKII